MAKIEVRVPDIGNFENVPIIEILIVQGALVKAEDPLITLESDKASIDIPSPQDGTIEDIKVSVGDKVSEGSLILILDTVGASQVSTNATVPLDVEPSPAATVKTPVLSHAVYCEECEVLVLGAGPGGYSAAFRSADLGMKTLIVERYARLGGVCLNVGCIPSKALLHTAVVMDEAKALATRGIDYSQPHVSLDKLRGFNSNIVKKLTDGLANMAKARDVDVVRGIGRFLDQHHIEVELTQGDGCKKSGSKKLVRFQKAIIAAGSHTVKLKYMPQDSRVLDSTGILKLESIPRRMLVVGGGIIGLEMATVYSTLGSHVHIVEAMKDIMPGADRELVKVWEKKNTSRFEKLMTKTRIVSAEATAAGIIISFEGEQAPEKPQIYDLVLVAAGRNPNGKEIDADKAGVAISEHGFIHVNSQMCTNVPHIFAVGDITGRPMLAHKAVHEAHVAAEAAAGHKSYFDARQIPSVAYTDPEVAWTGKNESQCEAEGIQYGKAVFPWSASGRAIANNRDEGMTKLIFDKVTRRVIGGGIVGTYAGELIGEICLAIEMGCDPIDISRTIHPHPTLCESIGMTADIFEGICTDLLPVSRK
jgi:dihydrolipoamide dehydrogenase